MKNLLIYFTRRIWYWTFKIKVANAKKVDNVNWEVNIMTDEEIKIGKQLRDKLIKIYKEHPEYRRYKNGMDRYEVFLEKMSEKYNISTIRIRKELIHEDRN